MSYATGTAHYNLPQTVGTDKRDWSDTNEAFAKIDAAIYGNTEANNTNAESITVLQQNDAKNQENIAQNASDITALETDVASLKNATSTNAQNISNNASAITDVRQDSEDMICAYNEKTATSTHYYAVGSYFIYNDILYKATAIINVDDTIVPNVNCAATNVTTQLLELTGSGTIRNDLEELITAYIESDNVADHAYAVGDTFIYQDTLYRCTAALSVGDTIVAGTNCVATTVMNEMSIADNNVNAVAAQLTASSTSGDVKFQFGVDSNGNYGYIKAGADTVTPFKSGSFTIPTLRTSCAGDNATSNVSRGQVYISNASSNYSTITINSLSLDSTAQGNGTTPLLQIGTPSTTIRTFSSAFSSPVSFSIAASKGTNLTLLLTATNSSHNATGYVTASGITIS